FSRKYGTPKEMYLSGGSMGGFLVITIMEKFPNVYDGGLALCGPLAPTDFFVARRGFDLRVVFDYYFPGVLAPVTNVPADFTFEPVRNQEIEKVLDSKPQQSEILRRFSGIRTNKELAIALVLFTHLLKDLQQRGGGNPFDNRNTIYEGTPDDNALNDGVARYMADPRAAQYVRLHYTPSGRLSRPVLHIHTTYDALVPSWVTNVYPLLTEQAGCGDLFVQQYVKRPGHCAIKPEEVSHGFAQLRQWKTKGGKY
ncbi:MAG: S9 family peptidase, partial [Acidobacteria bacterium]|nr:S9 family peptidase [Acidobacteriota bacterium]